MSEIKKEVVQKPKALDQMAERLSVGREMLEKTLRETAFRDCKTNEQFCSALIVANTYKLNPFLKEIYAFPHQGGVIPIVSIDGWISLVNRQKGYDGVELNENFNDQGELFSVTAKFFLKDRSHPVVVTEYMSECRKKSPAWDQWPARMLRHKAYIQGARIAFGFSGIYDEDEGARIVEATTINSGKPIVTEPKSIEVELTEEEKQEILKKEQENA